VDTVSPCIFPCALASLLGRPDAPLLLDVRRRERFAASGRLLPGARWCAPEEVAALAASELPASVVYCAYGHEASQDVTRAPCAAGWSARLLRGGIGGGEQGVDPQADLHAWRAAPLPRMRKRADPGVAGGAPSPWITRARPKIDRLACPWLLRHFLAPRALFCYVPGHQVITQAAALQPVPFDIEGVPISHAWERSSFDTLLAEFGRDAPGLDTLATSVRGADTDRLAIAPQAAGLLAISLGLSRRHADDDHDHDHAMLAAAMPLYDARYAWCRNGRGESHRWSAHAMPKAAP
jgi:rhodanese-related sulfurtransferase